MSKSIILSILRLFGFFPLKFHENRFQLSKPWYLWSLILISIALLNQILRIYVNSKVQTSDLVNLIRFKIYQIHAIASIFFVFFNFWTNLRWKNLKRDIKFLNSSMTYNIGREYFGKSHWFFVFLSFFPLFVMHSSLIIFEFFIKSKIENKTVDGPLLLIATTFLHLQRIKIHFYIDMMKNQAMFLEGRLKKSKICQETENYCLNHYEMLLKTSFLFSKMFWMYTHLIMFNICTNFISIPKIVELIMAKAQEKNFNNLLEIWVIGLKPLIGLYYVPFVFWTMNIGECLENKVNDLTLKQNKNHRKYFLR